MSTVYDDGFYCEYMIPPQIPPGKLVSLDVEYIEACPICGSKDIPTAYNSQWGGHLILYSQCQGCAQIFLNPRMTDEQTAKFYQGDYRDAVDAHDSVDGISPSNLRKQEARAKLQVEILGKYFAGCNSNLEIGCSAGYLMHELRKSYNFEIIVGIEPDERYHKIHPANLFPVHAELIPPPKEYLHGFDLITMSHVLEHLNHPLEYLRNLIKNYSHPGTKFMVEVPNVDHYKAFGLPHPFLFNLPTLAQLFARLGYACEAAFMHGMGEPQLYKYLLAVFKRINV